MNSPDFLLIILNIGLITRLVYYEQTSGSDKAIIGFIAGYIALAALNAIIGSVLKSFRKKKECFPENRIRIFSAIYSLIDVCCFY